ncbi:MAG: MBL fold metallo-hydrolase [Deferribacteres bacterium]|nr:MBL fold metallo-hydrolase [Deferribacteres bacterium]
MKTLILILIIFANFHLALFAQMPALEIKGKEVFRNEDVIIHQLDERTWVGSGHLAFFESIYIVEGDDKAVLIDTGMKITNLDSIVASITKKSITLIATHVHPDHVGSIDRFPEIYINQGDTANIAQFMPDYDGKVNYLKDGEIIDLGGRQLEVVFTPSHTPGSTTFIDKTAGYGFSGDSFGSGNLLLFSGTFSELIETCEKMRTIMKEVRIKFLYPGHFNGKNPETQKRISDLITLSKDVLSGKVKGKENKGNRFGLSRVVSDYGVRINYNEKSLK